MKTVALVAALALVAPAVAERDALRAPVLKRLDEGISLYRQGRYTAASNLFQITSREALAARLPGLASRAETNAAGCQFALRQYEPALKSFLRARRLAESNRDVSNVAVLDANIASVHLEMNEYDAAAAWAKNALARYSLTDRVKQAPRFLLLTASIRARQDRIEDATKLFREAAAAADQNGDAALYANAWNRMGEEFLKQGRLDLAEGPLLEAYRVRRLGGMPLEGSYANLGRLRFEQGDLDSAGVLLDSAIELSSRNAAAFPAWEVFHYRGRVRLARGQLREALDDLRTAMRVARAWRLSAPPVDGSRVGSEGLLAGLYSAFVEAGARQYERTRDPALLRETFEAAEETRAASLRALMEDRERAAPLPPEYWEAVLRLQKLEIAAIRSPGPSADEAIRSAKAEAARVEAAFLPAGGRDESLSVEQLTAALDVDGALLSFWLGDQASWLWALDREGLSLHRLGPRREIEALARRFLRGVENGDKEEASAGAPLYQALFGGLPARFERKSRWIIAPDGALFDVPFAALNPSAGEPGGYLVDRRAIAVLPGVGSLAGAPARNRRADSELLLGIGDPIYNPADSRWRSPSAVWASRGPELLVLPRLPGSARELHAVAQAWNGRTELLEGAGASREEILRAMKSQPAIIHFATHVVVSGAPAHGLIALSMGAAGEVQALTPADIARWSTSAAVVVMNGCDSASASAPPSTGLLGLTRAWLAAGAGAVVATGWPIRDDDGALLAAMYQELRKGSLRDPARALRGAQRRMIAAGGWRSEPRHWAAYFVVGGAS